MPIYPPRKLALEASSICQLKCPSCPRFTEAFQKTIGYGWLHAENFRALLHRHPRIVEVELANYGEIFLNPELYEIMQYAFQSKVMLTANYGVNLNSADDRVLEGLVKFGFHSLVCSLDGATPATYTVYRRQGDFASVIDNIKKINFYKRKYQTTYPILYWQFVIFGHNEREILMARQMAEELGMRFLPKLSWDENFSPIQDHKRVKKESGLAVTSRRAYHTQFGVDYMIGICHQLWEQPQINWDGKVLGCCRNFWGDFGGNAFADGLPASVNTERMVYARSMLLGKAEPRENIPCTTCDIYLTMQDSGNFLKRDLKYHLEKMSSHYLSRHFWRKKLHLLRARLQR